MSEVTASSEVKEWEWLFDRVLPLLIVAVLLTACILGSAKKEIWLDEVFTLRVITDRSLPHMMHALANGVDGGMPLYYLLAYGWATLFGTGLLALRLFSMVFVCTGVLLVWHTLRKAYSLPAVALAVAATTVTSAALLHQNVEARFYGFYFACAALVFACYLPLATKPITRRLVVGAVLASGALVMSHPFGVLYSAMAILALAVADYRSGSFRWKLYLALMSSWLLLLAWLGPILKIRDVAQPQNWPLPPTLTEVLSLFAFASPCLAFGLLAGVGLSALAPPAREQQTVSGNSAPLLILAAAYLLLPLPIAILSQGSSSMFVDRYFLPSLIAGATIVAYLLDSRLRVVRMNFGLQAAWLLVFAVMCAWPILSISKTRENRFEVMDRSIPYDLPVIVTDAETFLPLSYLTQKTVRPYYFPLDWEAALHTNGRGGNVNYKLMRNAKASGYSSDRILETPQVMCVSENFLVLDNPRYAWFRERVFSNPNYQVEHVGNFSEEQQLWLVKRLPNTNQCPEQ